MTDAARKAVINARYRAKKHAENPDRFCPPEHSHENAGTCWSQHGCRCAPCSKRENARVAEAYHARQQILGHNRLVPSAPVARKLRALAALGWSNKQIAAKSGIAYGVLMRARAGTHDRIYSDTARAVDAAFGAMQFERPEGRTASYLRRIAEAEGWKPPFAWDDIEAGVLFEDVDTEVLDHAAVQLAIAGEQVRHDWTDAELEQVVRVLNVEQRVHDAGIADRVGVHPHKITAVRAGLGIEPIPRDEIKAMRGVTV